jgi:hypothetical protein
MIGTSASVLAPSLPWQLVQVSTSFTTSAAHTLFASEKPIKALHANKVNPVAFCSMILFSDSIIRIISVFPMVPGHTLIF